MGGNKHRKDRGKYGDQLDLYKQIRKPLAKPSKVMTESEKKHRFDWRDEIEEDEFNVEEEIGRAMGKEMRYTVDDATDKDGATFFIYDGKTGEIVGDSYRDEMEAEREAERLNKADG